MKSRLYFGGIPVEPDVKKLEDAFPSIVDMRGTTIPHYQLEEILSIKRAVNPHRYRTVLAYWAAKTRRNTGVVIRGDVSAARGIGYRVLTDAEQVSFGVTEKRGAGRKIQSSYSAFADADDAKLCAEDRRVRDHGLLAARHIHTAIMESRKFLPKPPESPEVAPATKRD